MCAFKRLVLILIKMSLAGHHHHTIKSYYQHKTLFNIIVNVLKYFTWLIMNSITEQMLSIIIIIRF